MLVSEGGVCLLNRMVSNQATHENVSCLAKKVLETVEVELSGRSVAERTNLNPGTATAGDSATQL